MTLLAVSVFGNSIEQVRREIEGAMQRGADLIELRIDLMEGISDDDIHSLQEGKGLPLVLTIRSVGEGGRWDGDDHDLVRRLIELGPIADYIDIELASYGRSASIHQKLGQALRRAGHISQADGREEVYLATPRRLILSRHDPASRPATLHVDLLAMLDVDACRVPKIAWRARTIRDNFEAFETMRTSPRPAIIICLGEDGLLSRVLAGKFGAFATFAALAPGSETAAGQLPITDMKRLYRWDAIDGDTLVYGLIGDPVRHSLSPAVHNAAFGASGLNAVYVPMRVNATYESFKAFMLEVLARPWLDFRGFSVTIPHKENALRFIRESGGHVDELAERAGAVNTISLTPGGSLTGHNTDYAAALETICTGLNCQETDLAERRVAVLGAGGVARAVVAALTGAGARVTVFNRTKARARALAEAFGCAHKPWGERLEAEASLVVNCTSVGMWPDVGSSPIPRAALTTDVAVFDTIYNPLRTRLLRDAIERGCTTIDGLTMFVLQARSQFRVWTGCLLAPEVFRQAAEAALAPSSAEA